MAQTDMLKRYLDAGIAFTKMTQERAEAIVRDLVGAGEVGADQATNAVQDIVERSRENTEKLFESVRAEINIQIGNLGLATRDDIESLRREIASLRGRAATAAAPGAKRAPATKAGPLKKVAGGAVKAPAAKKAAVKKAPAKKAPAAEAGPLKKA